MVHRELVPDVNGLEFALWLLGRRQRLQVSGNSMLPLLRPGDEVLVNFRVYRDRSPVEGEIVVARHPHQPGVKIVKRVIAVLEDGRFILMGDNKGESTDSRHFGSVALAQIAGKVVSLFARKH
ncbi:MAG: nickel-type superoxide dismutase maturation protease [Cyanobacteriota bacterium]|nr:nickel-type superoxide dismutase maturation protease [Cyanobacteriota bacterium]